MFVRAMFVCCEVTVTDAYLIQRRMSRLTEYFIVLSKLLEQRGGLLQLKMRRDGWENGQNWWSKSGLSTNIERSIDVLYKATNPMIWSACTQLMPKPIAQLRVLAVSVFQVEGNKRDSALPPLKYKFLEEMKHQISSLDRESPNIFYR